jgi:rhomboid protease GluP
MRFARAIFERPYIFTIVFLVANIFVFLLMWERSGLNLNALWAFDGETLLRFGAKLNVLIDQRGEWWRFITPVFVHGGILHLLFNMYGLWILGPYVERLYGSSKFVVFWVVTGIAGVVGSYLAVRPQWSHGVIGGFLFRPGDGPSVGASGALFGLIGVLFVFGIKYRKELPEGFKRAFGAGMLPTILLNLFIGFTVKVIDNAAHLGGLLAGVVLALVVDYARPHQSETSTWMWRALQMLCLGVVIVSFGFAFANRNESFDGLAAEMPVNVDPGLSAYVKGMNEGEEQFVKVLNEGDISGVDQAIKDLENAPTLDPTAGRLRDDLKSLLIRSKQISTLDKQQPGESRALKLQLASEYQNWQKQRGDWITANKDKYGLTLSKKPDGKKKGASGDDQ